MIVFIRAPPRQAWPDISGPKGSSKYFLQANRETHSTNLAGVGAAGVGHISYTQPESKKGTLNSSARIS